MNARKVLLLLAESGIFAHLEDDRLHLVCVDAIPVSVTELAREHKTDLVAALMEAAHGLKMTMSKTDSDELIYCIALLNAHIDPEIVYQAARWNQEQAA